MRILVVDDDPEILSVVRQGLRQRRVSTRASVATSGGVSAGSMAACCAHHLADFLPLLGLSGLAAYLASYQTLSASPSCWRPFSDITCPIGLDDGNGT